MTETAEFITVVQDVLERSNEARAFLATMLKASENGEFPEELIINLVKTQSALELQDHLVRKLTESLLDYDDKLTALVAQINQ